MKAQALIDTARALVADDKDLLAMDESNSTCNKRFAAAGIAQTEETRRAYRELLMTTPGLGESISGAILYDETIRQQKQDGTPFAKVLNDAEILPGIKVDIGAKNLAGHPGETITEGLDGLRIRLQEYSQMGARFAKWRAVIALGDGIPSRGCIEANAQALARYAAGLGAVERHECQVQGATGAPALGAGFFIRSRDPAPGPGDLGGRGGPPIGGAASSVSSGPVQPGCAPRRIQCRDGNA